MTSSTIYNINDYLLLEFIHNGGGVISSSNVGFKRIRNKYNGDITITNDDAALRKTGNIIDFTVVDVETNKVLLDKDTGYYYPELDPNIVVENIAVPPGLNVTYDKVRMHILSGYNYPTLDGSVFSIQVVMNNNKKLKLCDLSYIKTDNRLLYFNPKPIKLANHVYDKYIEFLIPSLDKMLDDQKYLGLSQYILSYYLTDGVYLADKRSLSMEHDTINRVSFNNGIVNIYCQEKNMANVKSNDEFGGLAAVISENAAGGYFEYHGSWNGAMIEDFVYQLNSIAGNSYYIIHDIRIFEQYGDAFVETSNYTSIQTDRYDKSMKLRPIIENGSAVSFSI